MLGGVDRFDSYLAHHPPSTIHHPPSTIHHPFKEIRMDDVDKAELIVYALIYYPRKHGSSANYKTTFFNNVMRSIPEVRHAYQLRQYYIIQEEERRLRYLVYKLEQKGVIACVPVQRPRHGLFYMISIKYMWLYTATKEQRIGYLRGIL
jgi:hypothetical protein